MKLVFVYYAYENQGSELDLQGYTRAARAAGHAAIVYGEPNARIPLNYSTDISDADAVVFVLEWTTELQNGDRLDWTRLLSSVPRHRRVVIDCDGRYNDAISVHGDYNHRNAAESRSWIDFCDSLADKISADTKALAAQRARSCSMYDPTWEAPRFLGQGVRDGLRQPLEVSLARHVASASCCNGADRVGIALFGHGWGPALLGDRDGHRGHLQD
jgi:hypothetical protein